MMRSRTIMACAAVAAAALPATADASKSPAPSVKQAVFKATLSGSQVTTWTYDHKAQGGCDADATGNGSQQIKFGDNKQTFKVTFTTPPKKQPDLFGTAGRPAVLIEPPLRRVKATANREGEVKYGAVDSSACPGDNGGADPGTQTPDSDCGTRSGSFQPRLYFHDSVQDPDDLIVPIPSGRPETNRLSLDGSNWMWSTAAGGNESELRNTFLHCPFVYGPDTLDSLGNIYISQAKLSEKALFNKRRKHIVVSGDHISKRHDSDSSGTTILAWNLRLTRVK